jgi:hypothetical protein
VPAITQRLRGIGREAAFDLHLVSLCPQPRSLHGPLQGHAMVDQVEQRLHRRCENPQPARKTKGVDRFAIPQRDYR